MSRISRYQDSMSKYMKNKSNLTTLENPMKDIMYKLTEDCDYMISIILLTILSSQNRKNKTSLHGYYMGCGIELMMLLAKMSDNTEHYNKRYDETMIRKIIFKISSMANICLAQNIEYIQTTTSKDKTLKIFYQTTRILNEKLANLVDVDKVETGENIKKTDLVKYSFDDIKDIKSTNNVKKDTTCELSLLKEGTETKLTLAKNKLMSIKQAKKEHLMKFIQKKYGSVCQATLTIGWMLGNGNEKTIDSLEKLGLHLANMMKISYDFKNLETDLHEANGYSNNYIINFGIQDGFELFVDSKAKFIEGCMLLDLYTNTMKEVLDVIEISVDALIDKTKSDLKSQYTLTNSSK